MELRAEPRFETRSPAVVEVIRDKVYTFDATITEVSGVGLRIETPEELRVGETIRLLVNSYHMFAQVRGSKPGDSGFVIGLERIDAWNGPAPGASAPEKMAAASPVPVVGRPTLKKPLDNLHRAALRELFANPRFRTVPRKYQTAIIAAGCIAVAGWAGIGAILSIRSKSQGTTHAEAAPVKQLSGAPNSNAVVTNPVASTASSKPVIAPPVQTAHVAAAPPPTVQQTPVAVALPVQTARVANGRHCLISKEPASSGTQQVR